MKIRNTIFGIMISICLPAFALAQQSETEEAQVEETKPDEIIAYGTRIQSTHPGMSAFFDGDFGTAELEFEQEFKSLRRRISARENAIINAQNGILRSESTALAGTGGGSTQGGSQAAADGLNSGSDFGGLANNFSGKRDREGYDILSDGKATDEDFAYVKYMAGLSELQLGKNDEAKISFKRSLHYNSKNYDARMRLGLLSLLDGDFDEVADQLEALEKMRTKCVKRDCEDLKYITDSTVMLANAVNNAANN